MIPIVTTRFNDATWRENVEFREKNHLACVYSVSKKLSETIDYNGVVYVVEMNNSENQIQGIGLIRNHPLVKRYKVYTDNHWNRYCYIGHYYIARDTMQDDFLIPLETILFKGKSHLKRGSGMTTLTEKMRRKLDFDIESEIKDMFVTKYKNTET